MTATPVTLAGWTPLMGPSPIPKYIARFLAANAVCGKGQFATVDPTTGFAALNDGTVPNQVSVGQSDFVELTDSSATAGQAEGRFSERFFYGLLSSASGGDGFTDADFGVPFYIASENTLGKKTNLGGNNRSLGGLVFGVNQDGTPYAWTGVLAWLMARGVAIANSFEGGGATLADAAANTATAETVIGRAPQHGVVTAVQVTLNATVTASDTDNAVITISKRDGAGGAAVVVATYSTAVTAAQGAITAWIPANFLLSVVAGAVNVLETDILTITVTKGGAGKQLNGRVRVIQKVL